MDAEISRLTRALSRCDEGAWQDFHARYYGFLLARVMLRGIAESDAPEAVQRIYLRVLRHPKAFSRQSDFEAWLSCLARCEAIDTTRSQRRRSWLSEKFAHWTLLRQEETVPADSRLGEALKTLEGSDRALVTRHYVGGWTQEELAKEHGVTVKAIESRLARLRARLRSFMETPDTSCETP
jgi:RNA polymerase sigma-70 factor (ECF subfamily)